MAGLSEVYMEIVVFGRNRDNQASADLARRADRRIRDAAMRMRFCGGE